MRTKLLFLSFLCLFTLGGLSASAQGQAQSAAVKPLSGVKAGNCAGCHHDAKVLPPGHVDTTALTLSDCKGCHIGGEGNPPALETRIPMWHMHGLSGVSCTQCHTAGMQQPPTRHTCVQCHDPKALAEKTANMNPRNPHSNRHFGTEENCLDCHHAHQPSQASCTKCHNFKLQVP